MATRDVKADDPLDDFAARDMTLVSRARVRPSS